MVEITGVTVTEEEIRQAKKDYMKAYRKANKEKFREYQSRWWGKRVLNMKTPEEISQRVLNTKIPKEIIQPKKTSKSSKFQIDDTKLFS